VAAVIDKIGPSPMRHGGDGATFTLAFILLYFSLLGLLYHYVLLGIYLGQGWQTASLGEMPAIWGNDLTRMLAASAGFDPYSHLRTFVPFEAAPYPPFAFVTYGLLAQLGLVGAFVVFYGAFVGGLCALLWTELARFAPPLRALLCLAFFFGPFPVLYELDRGNLDGWTALLVWVAVLLQWRGSRRAQMISPVLIGLAAALKIYPVFYMLMYVERGRYWQLAVSIAAMILFTLAGLLILRGDPGTQIANFLGEMKRTAYCYTDVAACKNLSMIYPFKLVASQFGLSPSTDPKAVETGYQIFSLALAALTAAFVYLTRPALPLIVTLATALALWLPVMSFQYKLLLVLLAIFSLLREKNSWFDLVAILLAFALIPKRYLSGEYFAHGPINNIFISSAVVLAILLAVRTPSVSAATERQVTAGVAIVLTAVFSLFYLVFAAQAIFVAPFPNGRGEVWMSQSENPAVFGAGWGPFEADATARWRWTYGCSATLNIRLSADRDYRIGLDLLTHSRNRAQTVTVLLNDRPLGTQAIPPGIGQHIEFDVPRGAITPTKIIADRITIRTSECNLPDDGNGAQLGVAVYKVTVAPMNPP
jgi:Glycosyltransferase family 87